MYIRWSLFLRFPTFLLLKLLWQINGWGFSSSNSALACWTFQPRTFQLQASIPEFSTLNFLKLGVEKFEVSTFWFHRTRKSNRALFKLNMNILKYPRFYYWFLSSFLILGSRSYNEGQWGNRPCGVPHLELHITLMCM